jgi:hypothetical protein
MHKYFGMHATLIDSLTKKRFCSASRVQSQFIRYVSFITCGACCSLKCRQNPNQKLNSADVFQQLKINTGVRSIPFQFDLKSAEKLILELELDSIRWEAVKSLSSSTQSDRLLYIPLALHYNMSHCSVCNNNSYHCIS